MFKHIAVAVDFSPARDQLQNDLPKLRGWGCERLSLVHADRPLDTRIVRGAAPGVIIRTARETGADLVIVGKRGHNRLRELLLGSTAEAVCRRVEPPVLVVPLAGNDRQ